MRFLYLLVGFLLGADVQASAVAGDGCLNPLGREQVRQAAAGGEIDPRIQEMMDKNGLVFDENVTQVLSLTKDATEVYDLARSIVTENSADQLGILADKAKDVLESGAYTHQDLHWFLEGDAEFQGEPISALPLADIYVADELGGEAWAVILTTLSEQVDFQRKNLIELREYFTALATAAVDESTGQNIMTQLVLHYAHQQQPNPFEVINEIIVSTKVNILVKIQKWPPLFRFY